MKFGFDLDQLLLVQKTQICVIVELVVEVEKIVAAGEQTVEFVGLVAAKETDLFEIVEERIVAVLVVEQTGSGAVKSHSEVELVAVRTVSAAAEPAD